MQIPSVPPPIAATSTLPQDAIAKAVPNIQAMQPLVARAVDPPPKGEKSNQSRSNRDRGKGGGRPEGGETSGEKRGGSVNIRV